MTGALAPFSYLVFNGDGMRFNEIYLTLLIPPFCTNNIRKYKQDRDFLTEQNKI